MAIINSAEQWLGRQPYQSMWERLQCQAVALAAGEGQEVIWSCEHEPVYTTGRRGIDNRLGHALPAPVVQSDRGGEMTFHGPGQLVLYPVIHLRQRGLGVKAYVSMLEDSCIGLLHGLGIEAGRRCGFPGVWVGQDKIAALGIRVSRGVAYHGMALNVDVDKAWFQGIHPCGLHFGIQNISAFMSPPPLFVLARQWRSCLLRELG